jgi:16S rRNA G527 N7-methylase RsmG
LFNIKEENKGQKMTNKDFIKLIRKWETSVNLMRLENKENQKPHFIFEEVSRAAKTGN